MMQGYLWACRKEHKCKPKSLLQVCMEGKTLVYDIAQYTTPNDVTVLYDTELFFSPKTFVDTGFRNLWCPQPGTGLKRWNHLQANKDKSLFLTWDKSHKYIYTVENTEEESDMTKALANKLIECNNTLFKIEAKDMNEKLQTYQE